MSFTETTPADESLRNFQDTYRSVRAELEKVFVGQRDVVDAALSALLCDGHILLEGVPGLGKTLLAHTLGQVIGGSFSRIQFTPDLMPADITGSMVLTETETGGHEVRYQQGPIVANLVLADEINRATPKTQSAMLEAMQERQVSAGRTTVVLPRPFIVLATQNPIEHEGTYPLPEAQLDRFLVKLSISYPSEADYHHILNQTTGLDTPSPQCVCDLEEIIALQQTVRAVEVGETVRGFAIRLLMATQPHSPHAPDSVKRDVLLGASPRGAQALLLLAKVRALLDDRFAISCGDIRSVAMPVLRHRIVLSFDALADQRSTEDVIRNVLCDTKDLLE
jgi:MoxR-like ATPase